MKHTAYFNFRIAPEVRAKAKTQAKEELDMPLAQVIRALLEGWMDGDIVLSVSGKNREVEAEADS